MLKVLITGAYGLVGKAAYRHLVDSGEYEVHGLARRRLPSDRLPSSQLRPIAAEGFALADLTDRSAKGETGRGGG